MESVKKIIIFLLFVFLCSCAPYMETHSLVGVVTNVQMMHYDIVKTEPYQKCEYNKYTGVQTCDIYYLDRVDDEYRNYVVTYNANGFVGSLITYRRYRIGDNIRVVVTLDPRK